MDDPDFVVEIFDNFDFEKYLSAFEGDIVWDKSGLITGLVKSDWENNTANGQKMIESLLKNRTPSKMEEFCVFEAFERNRCRN